MRYYEVTTVTTVQALNKTEAELVARGRRGISGKILTSESWTDRLSAAAARENVSVAVG